ncbi:hypothetical protein JZ751_027641 [Albula glossodonta]|uniref:Uncharacterized protein n=1 Tax=Albula glossodonta TaxID=121402 RepID=A0A8T2PIA8_9TELE|nr:hypothetical protein JZ751_027641 [Albula glossodonta]
MWHTYSALITHQRHGEKPGPCPSPPQHPVHDDQPSNNMANLVKQQPSHLPVSINRCGLWIESLGPACTCHHGGSQSPRTLPANNFADIEDLAFGSIDRDSVLICPRKVGTVKNITGFLKTPGGLGLPGGRSERSINMELRQSVSFPLCQGECGSAITATPKLASNSHHPGVPGSLLDRTEEQRERERERDRDRDRDRERIEREREENREGMREMEREEDREREREREREMSQRQSICLMSMCVSWVLLSSEELCETCSGSYSREETQRNCSALCWERCDWCTGVKERERERESAVEWEGDGGWGGTPETVGLTAPHSISPHSAFSQTKPSAPFSSHRFTTQPQPASAGPAKG